jgi:hypothetical protein
LFLREWRLALGACLFIPVIALVNRYYGQWLHNNAEKVQAALAESTSIATEVIGAVRTVFSFANEVCIFHSCGECCHFISVAILVFFIFGCVLFLFHPPLFVSVFTEA